MVLTVATAGLAAYVSFSGSFGSVYGPLAGVFALLLWALLSSVALFYGTAVCAQLEALRAGEVEPALDDPGRPHATTAGTGSPADCRAADAGSRPRSREQRPEVAVDLDRAGIEEHLARVGRADALHLAYAGTERRADAGRRVLRRQRGRGIGVEPLGRRARSRPGAACRPRRRGR